MNSYRQILRSSSIIGGASVINILIGLLRTKVVALFLGSAGIGMIGLLQSLMTTASTIAALGFGNVGTRQIAEAAGHKDEFKVVTVRRALFWGTLLLACIGALIFWLLRDILAKELLSDSNMAESVGWLSLGVALTVASGSQSALLSGLRRIGDIARVSLLSGILATLVGMAAIWLWGEQGVLVFVLAAPLASFLVGHLYVARLTKIQGPCTPLSQLMSQWLILARLGAAFMLAGLVVSLGHLLVRAMVQRELGVEALGHFQAAWMISMTYIGFVLGAMGTDYYPRLTAVIHDKIASNNMVNEQTEVALLLAGPVFLFLMGFTPFVIELLYSNQFSESIVVLRWQILGDILKVVTWPLGFIILASGDGRTFMITETIAVVVFVGITWLGLPLLDIQATGVAFLCMYAVLCPIVYRLAKRRTGFSWDTRVIKHLTLLMLSAVVICILAIWSELAAASMGGILALVFGLYGFAHLGHMLNLDGYLGRASVISRNVMIKLGIWHG